jgi:hypothetical protein
VVVVVVVVVLMMTSALVVIGMAPVPGGRWYRAGAQGGHCKISKFFLFFFLDKSYTTASHRRGPRNRPSAPAAGADVEATYISETAVARRFERAAARPRPSARVEFHGIRHYQFIQKR